MLHVVIVIGAKKTHKSVQGLFLQLGTKRRILPAEGVTDDHAKTLRWGPCCGRIVAVGASGSIVTDSVKVVGVL